MESSSTILIKNTTRERLKRMGSKAQTYDQLINRLIDLSRNKKYHIDSKARDSGSDEY